MNAIEWPCTNEQYHARVELVSNSMREDFRSRRAYYHAVYVAKSMARDAQTKEMRIGNLTHAAVLEPHVWESNYVIAPKFDRRTNAGKLDAAAWVEANEGKTCVDPDEWRLVEAMRDAIFANSKARKALEAKGPFEHTITWECRESGLQLRSRRDKWAEPANLLIDLKTWNGGNATAFGLAMAKRGYHRQASFYQAGHHELTGEVPAFAFITVSKKPPHPVGLFYLDEADASLGARQVLKDLLQISKCHKTGNWNESHELDFVTAPLPKYAHQEDFYYGDADDDNEAE